MFRLGGIRIILSLVTENHAYKSSPLLKYKHASELQIDTINSSLIAAVFLSLLLPIVVYLNKYPVDAGR